VRLSTASVLTVSGVLLLVVSTGAVTAQETEASAELQDGEGNTVGNAQITEGSGGTEIAVQARGLKPGEHGIHVHETGECGLPEFDSAGKHFNPEKAEHGLKNPEGPHAGDLPNLTADKDGTATYETTTGQVSSLGGETYLFDADDSALVIHAKADDQTTDPAGDSGDRVACGIIKTSAIAQKGSSAAGASGILTPRVMLVAASAFILIVAIFLWRRS
jgi:Cu-Zn family superoxide dismutase